VEDRGFELSAHASSMLIERSIPEEWLWRALQEPDEVIEVERGKIYLLKAIPENEGRILRVVVNSAITPNRVVTLYFDRTLRRK
jgi:hypothetical protein